jgi:hypothetical protein
MAEQAIDYAALAKANGATASTPPPVDYEALAREHGGTSVAPSDSGFVFKPGESTGAAMLRYGGEELKGAARSPIDALRGLANMPAAVVKGWTEAIPTLLRDPSLLAEAPRAVKDAVSYYALHPDELGSLLGQAVVGKAVASQPLTRQNVTAAAARAAESPLARNVAATAVKHGSTAVGATVAGTPGAVIGASIGEQIAGRIRKGPAAPVSPVEAPHMPTAEGYSRYEPSISTYQPPPATSPVESAPGGTPPPSGPPPAAPTPAPVAESPVPSTAPQKSPQMLLNEEALARRRAAYQASQASPETAAVLAEDMSAAELQAYHQMRNKGIPDAVAKNEIVRSRRAALLMNQQFGLKTPTEAQKKFPKGMRGKATPPNDSGS